MKKNILAHHLVKALLAIAVAAFIAPLTAAAYSPNAQQARALRLSYELAMPQPHTHLYEVTFNIGNINTPHIDLQMPTWTPGSYLQREFARNVQDFAATGESGKPLGWQKIDKATWRIETGAAGATRTVRVFYRVYANELSVRTSHLDASHAYFNGASVFMYVAGATDQPIRLKINPPAGWRVTTPLGLAPEADGFYAAPNYDILVDSPTEIGTHRLIEFDVRGKPHRIAIWGEGNYNEAQIKDDTAKIVEQGALMFGGLPYDHYTFILHVQHGIGGGLEHLNSTTLQTRPGAFRPRRNYIGFLDLVAHEFFHLWNVKRIRPATLGPFDYQKENYTRALWVMEGFTDYYAQQLLRRAKLISAKEYLDNLAREIMAYEATPGRKEQSAEEASFDAWIKFYRPDENSSNTSISYYRKGGLLALLLDLEIRKITSGRRTLDDVMRYLYETYALRGVGFPENELKGAFERIAGADLTEFWTKYISGTEEIDFNRYFRLTGLELEKNYKTSSAGDVCSNNDGREQRGDTGLQTRATGDRVFISTVLAETPAYNRGINSGDELVAINGERITAGNIAEKMNAIRAGQRVTLTVFRRERLMTFDLVAAAKPPDCYQITALKDVASAERALQRAWLGEEVKIEKAASSEDR